MQTPPDKLLNNEYRSRLNRAIDYIQNNYEEELNLDKLAEVACFSKFHFHRLFRVMVGETVNNFVRRVRLEKSIQKLVLDASKSITDIALEWLFQLSELCENFKTQYGVPPSTIRSEFQWYNWKTKMMKLRKKEDNILQPAEAFLHDIYSNKRQLPIDKLPVKASLPEVNIVDMPPLRVAYLRSIGSYEAKTVLPAYKKLLQWAKPRGLMTDQMIVLGILWNNPDITPEDKLIHDACIVVPESIKADSWIDIQIIPGGIFAVHHCETPADRIDVAWMSLIMNWLVSSDYQPDDRPLYQIYYNDPETHPLKHQILDLYLPIKPLYG